MSEEINSFIWMIVGLMLACTSLSLLMDRFRNYKRGLEVERQIQILENARELNLVVETKKNIFEKQENTEK
ncbi:MAG: hypothetical protein LBD38_05525 [Streptococcaceae bacterium]|jgi:hypothetical protein|nr:hypothetical protein [Streptococcaceae bacterium]